MSINEKIIEEVVEEKKETEKKSNKKSFKQGIGKKIFNIIFWVVVIVIAAIWVTDYIKVRNDEEPNFCISKKTHKFDDGNVVECVGLGYKTYEYNRSSMAKGIEFGPFFMSMKKK